MKEISLRDAVALFRDVCNRACEEQEQFLSRLLSRNAGTEFGQRHGFKDIHSGEQYARSVPLSEFSDYDGDIARIIYGARNILSAEAPVFFNISAGSTGKAKYVPLCREDIAKQHLYEDLTVCGIILETLPQYSDRELFGCIFNIGDFFLTDMPDGIMNGVRSGAYFRTAKQEGSFNASCFSAPEEVLFPEKLEDMLYVKLRFALAHEDVTAIHGVFVHRMVSLFRYIEKNWDALIDDIEKGTVSECFPISDAWREYLRASLPPNPRRAAQLRALDRATLRDAMATKLWNRLRYVRVISGHMFSAFSKELSVYTGSVPLHSFAYASSESNIGIAPRVGVTDEYVLLPDVCYFEFIPEAQMASPSRLLTIRQIETGKRYELVITTLSGLYRYRIGDVVEVVGFYGEAPAVRICYRKDLVISLLDEHVNVMQFESAMDLFSERTGVCAEYYCVTGNWDGVRPRYVVYLEPKGTLPAGASEVLDQCLCECSLGYKGVRSMNELASAQARLVKSGTFSAYEHSCREKGMRTEQAKLLRVLTDEERIRYFEEKREMGV